MLPLMICLHASESNIEILKPSLNSVPVDVRHVVDTHLLKMIQEERPINEQKDYAYTKIMQLVQQNPMFILVTCTNYIVLLDQIELPTNIPILKIDEILFEQLRNIRSPIKMLFTNKHTIEGTMARLKQTLSSEFEIDVIFIPEAFDKYLAGDKFSHDEKVFEILNELDYDHNTVVVAQLSMVTVADNYNNLSGNLVFNPLTRIKSYLEEQIYK